MTVKTESKTHRTQPSGGGDAQKALRHFFVFGPEAAETGPDAGLLPVHLAPFRGVTRVRTEFPLFLGPRHLESAQGDLAGGVGALCLGFDELMARVLRTLEGEGAGGAVGQILRDNLKRFESHVLDLLADEEGGSADPRQTLLAAGGAMAEALAKESGLSDADREALANDVARMVDALPPAPEGTARLVGPRRGVALTLLRHALLDGHGTTRDSFVHETRELVAQGRAMLDADRRKGPEARKAEAAGSAMGEMGKRFVNPSAMASVLGDRRGSEAMAEERRERLEGAVTVLEEALERFQAPTVHLIHDGSVAWLAPILDEEGDEWTAETSTDPCASAAEVFDRSAERLAEALRARERVLLETSGEYEADRHEPWLEQLAGLDWRSFAAGDAGLIEPVIVVEAAGALADRGVVSLSKLLRSNRPVQVLVDIDPAIDPGAAEGADPGAESRFEPAYLGMSHREAFVQQSSESRPLHLVEGFLRAASSSRTALHVVAPWPETVPADLSGREGGQIHPALLSGAAVDGRAHPLFRYDPETGPSWAHRLDFGGNTEPAEDWVTGEDGGDRPFTFADFALLDPRLRRYLRPVAGGGDDLTPLAEWLELPSDEALHKIPTTAAVDASGRELELVVSRALALACRDRLGFWRTLQELAGVKSEYARRAAEAVRDELEQAAREERERMAKAHAAEIELVRERASREAVDRLTSALLDVDLGLFAEQVPTAPSFVGKTVDEVAESLLSAVGSVSDEELAAGDGSPPASGAVAEAADRLLALIDTPDLDRALE